jgi:dTDP-4-amino-4,6-dideoxygalactose transaminase
MVRKKYHHKVLGCNSRLDTIQAAVLKVKLQHLDEYSAARNKMADYYDENLAGISEIQTPKRAGNSTHVFHQYTLRVKNGKRDELQKYLAEKIFQVWYIILCLFTNRKHFCNM